MFIAMTHMEQVEGDTRVHKYFWIHVHKWQIRTVHEAFVNDFFFIANTCVVNRVSRDLEACRKKSHNATLDRRVTKIQTMENWEKQVEALRKIFRNDSIPRMTEKLVEIFRELFPKLFFWKNQNTTEKLENNAHEWDWNVQ